MTLGDRFTWAFCVKGIKVKDASHAIYLQRMWN
jgi:hypothetical protein